MSNETVLFLPLCMQCKSYSYNNYSLDSGTTNYPVLYSDGTVESHMLTIDVLHTSRRFKLLDQLDYDARRFTSVGVVVFADCSYCCDVTCDRLTLPWTYNITFVLLDVMLQILQTASMHTQQIYTKLHSDVCVDEGSIYAHIDNTSVCRSLRIDLASVVRNHGSRCYLPTLVYEDTIMLETYDK